MEMFILSRAAQHEAHVSDLFATLLSKVLRRLSPRQNSQSKLCEWVNARTQGFAYKEISLGGSVKEVGLKDVFKQGE